jgi:multidrug efflux pump subunit AcrB
VQNGLVVVERLRAARNTADARAEAGKRIAPAVLGSTLTTTVVLLPFLYLQGNARAMFAPFAGAFAIALFWSVATALVFVPAVGQGRDGQPHGWPRLARVYERMVAGTLRWRRLTIAFTLVALAVLTWGFINKVPKVDWGRGFGPTHETISASVGFPRGSDPAAVEHMISELESDAIGQPGVAVVRSQGSSTSGDVIVEFTAEGSQSDAPWVVSDKLIERAVLVGGADHISVSKPQGAQGFYGGSGGGVVAAFWITKTAFTREAAVGVILVVGLAVNHSILLIDAALQARRASGNRLTMADALHAATDRVTMIVLVTLTTLASLIPMAVGTSSDSLFGAIALATAGGTVVGTLGVMFVLPAVLMGWRRRMKTEVVA